MGGGEDYVDSWWKFWDNLTEPEKQQFKQANSAPEGWEYFYK